MMEDKDKIKDLFSSKLGNFEPEVPASVWGGLDQLLSNQPAPAPDASSSVNSSTANAASSAGKASIIKTVAIAVGVAAAIVTGVLLMPEAEPVVEQPVAVEETPVREEVVQPLDTVLEMPLATRPLIAKAEVQPVVQARAMIIEDTDPVEETREEVTPEVTDEPEKVERKPMIGRKPMMVGESEMLNDVVIGKSGKGFSIGITGNAGLLSDNSQYSNSDVMFSHHIRTDVFNDALNKENSEFELEHRQPISFGVTISKQLTPRLSIETGLIYTHLSSKVKSNSAFKISESQYINYLGVPVSLNYTFYELGQTKFYFSLGGMVQKDINGRYISNVGFSLFDIEDESLAGHVFYSEPYYVRESVKQSHPQFSVRSSIGVSYPLYKKLYLYGTIGGAYYFDAGNKHRTIYSDKKTQLDLNLGIKFDF
ncbi:hypothetical protein [Prevotella sp. 10(H)]|uniref:hypothetical protein n=1 Tax=Prevotella sp. 10(H) TaxID=1158294 RepID=UPI0004A6FF1B|nr:hypothetical protein [Prevotella sp. 10(H)]